MKKFTYNGKEYDFHYTMDDESVVERYDNAERGKNRLLDEIRAEKLPKVEENHKICSALCKYVNGALGDDACDGLIATEVIKFANTLLLYVAKRMKDENSAGLQLD